MLIPSVFDFEPDRLRSYSASRIDRLLQDRPVEYLAHLSVARQLDTWIAQTLADPDPDDERFDAGFVAALRAVRDCLRQGDFTPGGLHGSRPRDGAGTGPDPDPDPDPGAAAGGTPGT
ncbi:hypothetical protein DEI81_10155 [Curtobacterium sp. MCBD17_013]|uniref:hypothetical protein n=1 Tax=Curtobacterium sp. MCBD17_013 TaxID=2175668 RepID=UPI000DA8456B|nr:hypothetical protein [Curtobacterium sp. MCBD17_013]PZF61756.1 hypothetical protein DEI81_10155 [Curtobacterium sp. MCBD17_013]